MNKKTLIIGYGNLLRGDDGLGWGVVGYLANCIEDQSVEIIAVQQLTPELCESINDAYMTIFIDASSEGTPGTWRCERVEPAEKHDPTLGHHFNIAQLLAYTGILYHSCPRAMVISVTAESFDCNDDLSPSVEMVIPDVVQFICDQIASLKRLEARNN